MAERTDRVGQRFGDYWLRRRLGGGGFGDVYLGEHVRTQSLAAVKVLRIRLTRSEELRAFINEVRTFRLQHPHIVRVLDVGIALDDTPFLVTEYAPQGTLRDRHPRGTRLPLSTVLAYVVPLASALQYAHDLHLVHRDVKPENMLLGPEEVLWLSDFGIATVAHSTHSLTTEGMGGTLPYMAPEQIQGRPRPQSDQYALAVVVYEWLTGTWPFRGTPIEIAMQHQMTSPPALCIQIPTLPPEVEQVVLTALSKDPQGRFANVQAFATALVQAAQAPLEQNVSPEMSQGGISAAEYRPGGASVEAAKAEQQQAGTSNLRGSQIGGAFPPPSTANIVSEGSSGSFPVTSESLTSSVTSIPPLPEILSRPPAEQSDTSRIPGMLSPVSPFTSPPSAIGQTKRRHSLALIVLILLTLLVFGGGIYWATGNWPGSASRRQPTSTLSRNSDLTTSTATAPVSASVPVMTWHTHSSGTSQTLFGVVWSGSQFVAVGVQGTILTSPDAHNWTTQHSGTSEYLLGVAWSGSQFVVVGGKGTILTSPDGGNWTTQAFSTLQDIFRVAWLDSQFVAVGASGTILTSPNGRIWTAQTSGTSQFLDDVAWSGSQFVAVGASGTILTSPDAHNWTAQSSGTSLTLRSVAWSGSQFVAVGDLIYIGDGPTILTSPDAHNWTAQSSSSTSSDLLDVAWSGSLFVAVGSSATILASLNGRTWTAQSSGLSGNINPKDIESVAWSGSQFVAVGGDGASNTAIILTSP